MATFLSFGRDIQGFNAYAPQQSSLLYSAELTNAAHSTITVPSTHEQWIVVMTYEPGTVVWVSIGGTAALPSGGTFATTTSELTPSSRTVFAGQVIDFITADATADVGVAFYAVP